MCTDINLATASNEAVYVPVMCVVLQLLVIVSFQQIMRCYVGLSVPCSKDRAHNYNRTTSQKQTTLPVCGQESLEKISRKEFPQHHIEEKV